MIADPEGLFEVWADDWSLVENYRFGTCTCDFLICRRCGVFHRCGICNDVRNTRSRECELPERSWPLHVGPCGS
jgi:hypothetical protein